MRAKSLYQMPIIGKLLRKTNAITYRRNLKKKNDLENQLFTLDKLLSKAKKTAFGQANNFSEILQADDLCAAFQQNVPITDYEIFYTEWLSTAMEGTKDHIWPGRIRHYALSSGTTGSPSKRIPITNQMIDSFQKSTIKQLSTLHELNLPDKFYSGQILVVGGSSKLVKKENHLEGDLSGILKKYTPFFISSLTKPGSKITKQSDWNVKIDMMVEKAAEWNISVIAGVPSWCILLMERIIAYYDVKTIHDIWPNLDVYAHGGVFLEPYIPRLERVLDRKINLIDTYLASEGYFAYQTNPQKKGMQLLLSSGIYFEFIPFNSDYFDSEGEPISNSAAFTIDEVEPNIDYAIVISTNAGLWRYLIGDLVRFTDIEQREIIITGRIKQFLSLVGEHLSLDNINQAILTISQRDKIEINEFTIYANDDKLNHHWFIGTDNEIDGEQLMQKIDGELKNLNDDYGSSRKVNLKNPDVTVIPTAKFYEFMEEQGKLGSQNKFPRVMNKKQSKDWLKFLEESGTLAVSY